MDDFPYRKNLSLQMLEEGFHIFKLRFLYFGSYALRLYEPEKLKSFSPPDIDLLVDNDKEKLLSLAKYLHQKSWEVRIWGEEYRDDWDPSYLEGKFYMRLKYITEDQKLSTLDITYESPYLNFSRSYAEKEDRYGYPLCSLKDLWYLKLLKNSEKALAFAKEHALIIPKQSKKSAKSWKITGQR